MVTGLIFVLSIKLLLSIMCKSSIGPAMIVQKPKLGWTNMINEKTPFAASIICYISKLYNRRTMVLIRQCNRQKGQHHCGSHKTNMTQHTYYEVSTVLQAKSDSAAMFCLQSYQGLIIHRSLVYLSYPEERIDTQVIYQFGLAQVECTS